MFVLPWALDASLSRSPLLAAPVVHKALRVERRRWSRPPTASRQLQGCSPCSHSEGADGIAAASGSGRIPNAAARAGQCDHFLLFPPRHPFFGTNGIMVSCFLESPARTPLPFN